MDSSSKVLIVGAGNMGSTIAKRWAECGVEVILTAHSQKTVDTLASQSISKNVKVVLSNEGVEEAGVIVLAVKPVNLQEVYEELTGKLCSDCLVISVVAGVNVESLITRLEHKKIIRCMPNLAAVYGEGVTVWYPNNLDKNSIDIASKLFGFLGKECRVQSEDHINLATALFGSGPAFVYYFMEALVESGLLIGFPKDHLRELIVQMVRGSAIVAENNSHVHLAKLREDICSTGGTTVEGIVILDEYRVKAAVKETIKSTLNKSRRLMNG